MSASAIGSRRGRRSSRRAGVRRRGIAADVAAGAALAGIALALVPGLALVGVLALLLLLCCGAWATSARLRARRRARSGP
jgi:hypothetical protein